MAWTMYAAGEVPNLVSITARMDPNGKIAKLGELLDKYQPIIQDVPLVESNLPTGHQVMVRSDMPTTTWRLLNYGVRPSKSHSTAVTDTIGMLEAYSEVDKDLAMLNGNTAEWRMSEDSAFLEQMTNDLASALFYADVNTYPQQFMGLAPRYANLGSPANKPTAITNSSALTHVVSAGGSTVGAQSSLWYVRWDPNTVFGIYPKGSKAGLQATDHGEVTLFDNDGGRYQGFRSHYQWKFGLCVKDWRYIVRVANVEVANLADATAQKNLYQAMIKALHTVPPTNLGRGVFYCSSAVLAMLDLAAVEKANMMLGYNNVFGQEILTFRGVPIKPCSALLETEAVVTA